LKLRKSPAPNGLLSRRGRGEGGGVNGTKKGEKTTQGKGWNKHIGHCVAVASWGKMEKKRLTCKNLRGKLKTRMDRSGGGGALVFGGVWLECLRELGEKEPRGGMSD